MYLKPLLFPAILLASYLPASAQTFVPPNMDFESGTTANWTFYRGTLSSGHFTMTSCAPVSGLHTLTSGAGTDAYGGFPVVGLGGYSLKLGHDTIDNNADAASYNVHVPTGGAYKLIFNYAAVLQDTMHAPTAQPLLKVSAIDSATGARLSDSVMVTPMAPGFSLSGTGTDIFYKGWSTDSLDLSGYGGETVTVTFAVGGCTAGAHFGYGYIDVNHVSLRPGSLSVPGVSAGAGSINLYPNPTSGTLNVQWTGQQTGAADVIISDMTGRTVCRQTVNMNPASGSAIVNLGDVNAGLYLVSVRSAGMNYTGRVVVDHL